MTIQERFKAAISGFRRDNNSMGQELSRSFLRYGNNKPLVQDWSKVMMSDRDIYSGYPYAAINNRANKVAQLANENLKTDATPEVMKAAKAKEQTVEHPYLTVIDTSPTFSNNKFWYDISTFLDLEGVYYLLVVRAVGKNPDGTVRAGTIQEFQLLNPYDMRRIINKETLVVGGYVEARDGMVREFPTEMIIEMRKLNPFSYEDPFSMTDAAKESQYTLKQAGDYTRHSLKNNMAAPGIISTDVLLDTQQFQNFVSRVTNQEKGLPLFGNGAGAITWDSMQIDMDKAALDKINEINRQTLFAVSGVGKTMMSIEESGTTRDTARAQKEIFVEGHVMPQLQIILDALNQDYKTYSPKEYATNKYRLLIDNPLGSDRAAELQDVQIRDESYKLYDELVADGYDRDLSAKYASGEINLEELGEPANDPRPNPIIEAAMLRSGQTPENPNIEPPAADKPKPKDKTKPKPKPKAKPASQDTTQQTHEHDHLTDEDTVLNKVDDATSGIIQTAQGALQNTIVNIEGRIVSSVINNITKAKNAFESQADVITAKEKKEHEEELALALAAFYTLLIPVLGKQNAAKRVAEFGGSTIFTIDNEIKKYVKELSNKVSDSHVNTVVEDVRKTAQNVFNDNVKAQTDAIEASGRSVTDADLVEARKLALKGASESKIVSAVKTQYSDQITEGRAKAIARTETNRAFTQSQYLSDKQFIEQNGFQERAYKKLQTRSTDPCPVCSSLAEDPPIPFYDNFASIGDTLSASYTDKAGKTKVQTINVNFEDITAGNIHTNCSCVYVLIIKGA